MFKSTIILILIVVLLGCENSGYISSPPAQISISSDGQYVLSTHYGRYLMLWDITNKKSKILNKVANIYSPFFIPNTHNFIWQDAETNKIYVQSLAGEIIKTFDVAFPVYGHILSENMDNYIASKDDWSLFQLTNNEWKEIKHNPNWYPGSALLLQFSFTKNFLLTAGEGQINDDQYPIKVGSNLKNIKPDVAESHNDSLLDGVVLWDINISQPILKLPGNVSKTKATLSPDARYVVAGDENIFIFSWDTKTGKRSARYHAPLQKVQNCELVNDLEECEAYLSSKGKYQPQAPADYMSIQPFKSGKTVAIKFINEKGDFIKFTDSARYAVLYNINTPRIQAFMDLGSNPHPTTFSVFTSSNTIDTAPKAGILVMGQTQFGNPDGNGTGIIVYKFDEQNKKLVRIWAPDGPGKHRRIDNPDNKWEG